ncbi:DoxX family protein [Altererythrobacter salegens]|uniref:DoxX family protein n=1 Tax=Croceibacterium salegens TaxID=1737568 RepID=A0A6I4SY10_9SPHN|nr:DoxX family protein [Croceibacterium salegens]MXO60239.1 DoxX family protein [Croceibacterium salegens]
MASTASSPPNWWPISGRVLSGLVIAFLLMDATMKIAALPAVAETSAQLGWTTDAGFWRGMGVLLLALTALYAWPRTAMLGAVLLTGYLGGAIATHVRVGSPMFSHILFGLYLGVMLWGGLWFRSPALRHLFPLVKE